MAFLFGIAGLSALAAVLSALAGGTLVTALAVFAGGFAAVSVVSALFFAVVSCTVDDSVPLEKQKPLCRIGVYVISSLGCFWCGERVSLVGKEKLPRDGTFVLVSNHCSGIDPIALISVMPRQNVSFISKPSNMKMPVLGRLSYGAGFLPIDRDHARNALKTVAEAVDYLQRGVCSIAVYPEGTRNRGAGLLPFHHGSFKLPQRAGVPLVIAATCGTATKKGKPLFGRRITIRILETLDAQQVCSMTTAELAQRAETLIRAAIS